MSSVPPEATVLVANRGEIACRIARSVRAMGLRAVAVYSEADAGARHVRECDDAVEIGPASAAESYLRINRIMDAARQSGADAIHPGYGFLSENPDFATAVEDAGLRFCGPTPDQIRAFGRKDSARALAREVGVPLLPGSGVLSGPDAAILAAREVGFPVMLKSTAGGGGIGMAICAGPNELADAFAKVARLSHAGFGSGDLYLERYLERARHVEVQVFGDGRGEVIALGERDCSLQRRNQKVLEETPAPGLPPGLREELAAAALRLCRAVDYRSAGTVEFLVDADTGEAYFLEVNTRLQVEHTVTEEVYGIDLVEWMVRLAYGAWVARPAGPPRGHAIQARIYAEDPARGFRPSPGLLTQVAFPSGVRCDTWVETGTEVTPHYDPLLAKVVVRGADREEALRLLEGALAATDIHGVETNLDLLRAAVRVPAFTGGAPSLSIVGDLDPASATVEVLDAGLQASLHEHPGRLGYWAVGVPPSGPMDDFSCRLANRILGNPEGAVTLEATRLGPTLRFACDADACLGGARMEATVDGQPVAWWQPLRVRAGQVLRLGGVVGPGARTYLAVAGGFVVPRYLGSGTTFILGGFGGHGGRALRAGDVLRLRPDDREAAVATRGPDAALLPALSNRWGLGVLYGPHGAPDFFTPEYVDELLAATWSVHHNSDRTGVRLVGPRPGWARSDGGDAGIHPSNIHDTPYAIGAVDFTGDLPVILGPDGPSLGGFVCPVTVASHERWKLGQLSPGDKVRFALLDPADADALRRRHDEAIATLRPAPARTAARTPERHDAVLATIPADAQTTGVVYRRGGDENVLVEYGAPSLDIAVRMRIHALETELRKRRLAGVLDITAGIRSLQVHFDPNAMAASEVMEILLDAETRLPDLERVEVPTRIVHLPLSWDDNAALLAVERYMLSVRADAPWCPSNTEFIRRVNGLVSVDQVREIVYSASYLVLGLGDVYLGAPVAVPVDPRHRLVTTKYNPARTWTPENAVGIGGAYMCVYGMEGPGGYQLVGRTVPVWRTWRRGGAGEAEDPWLLRLFDQIRFFPASASELALWRRGVRDGTREVEISEETFRLRDHLEMVASVTVEAEEFRRRRQDAFREEIARWADTRLLDEEPPAPPPAAAASGDPVAAHLAGNVWRIEAREGDRVSEGDVLAVLEAMKMEVSVTAPRDGTVAAILCEPGDLVMPGQALMTLEELVGTAA